MEHYYYGTSPPSSAAANPHRIHHNYIIRSCSKTRRQVRTRISRDNDDDVIIVGAGVAGSSLAYTLAKDGRRVRLIERSLMNRPNTVAGELLQPAGYLKLLELGLGDCLADIEAQMVHGYKFYKGERSVILPYYPPNSEHPQQQHFTGRAFRHGHFVQKLREKAASHSNVKLEQGTVTSLIEEEAGLIKGVHYKTCQGQESTLLAPLTVVCDGYFSSFRKFLAKPKVHKLTNLIGLILENVSWGDHPGYAHVMMGDISIFAMFQLSSTEVRLFIDTDGLNLPSISNGDMDRFLKTKVAPQLPKEVLSAFITSVEKGDFRTMPITCMPASPKRTIRGALLLGDSLNIRHAMTGGGMTVALQDVSLLRNLFKDLNLEDTDKVTKAAQQFYNDRKQKAFTLNFLANSLSKVVYKIPLELRKDAFESCFNYLSLEFDFPQGFIGLISGLDQKPLTLLQQVVAMAAFVSGSFLLSVPSPERLYNAARFASDATADVMNLLLDEAVNFNDLLLKQKLLMK